MRLPNCRNVARASVIAAAGALASGCQSPFNGGGIACTTEFVYGISAKVTDAATGADITPGSYLVVREGAYVDSVAAGPGSFLAAAGERAGTYDVKIGRPGYSTFTRTGVRVTRNECHVNPVLLEARLLKQP